MRLAVKFLLYCPARMRPEAPLVLAALAAASTAFAAGAAPAQTPKPVPANARYRDPKQPIEKRVADLLGRMTLDEKIAQLVAVNWQNTRVYDPKAHVFAADKAKQLAPNGIGEIARPSDDHDPKQATEFADAVQKYLVEQTRLGIPAMFHEESLHGFQAASATSFPQAIALAATFDPDLAEQIFTVAARQARARGVTHVLAPVVDVARDPRWGRIEETFGEDPYLVTRMGVAAVRGFQGRREANAPFEPTRLLATAKHFTGHGTPEGGRNTAPGNYSPHVLREVFLPPFEALVRDAHVAAVMASYNEVDGIPSHANRWLLRDLLRGEWGFPGLVVSDYFGVGDLERKHHVVDDLPEAGRTALNAGVDMELPEPEGFKTLADDVKAKRVKQSVVDEAVARVLRAKFQLGLFEKPYVDVASVVPETAADRALARRAAEEAVILLKNDRGLLPLDPARLKTIAVVGPLASSVRLGGYSGTPDRVVTVADGIRARVGNNVKVVVAQGCGLTTGNRGWADDVVELSKPADDAKLIAEAAKAATAADVVVLALGQNEQLSREGWADNHRGDRMDLNLVGKQMDLARTVLATGRPTILLLLHGGPLALPELTQAVLAVIDGFSLGEETGTAVAEVLFGDVSPSGKLPVSIPRSVGTIPAYYNYKPSARRVALFEDPPGPMYPFGFGLSYTTFKYSGLTVTPAKMAMNTSAPNGKATVSVTITNTGKLPSEEIAQLYIHDVVSSVTRPVQELKGFRRVPLAPGETKKVEFTVGPDELAFWNEKMKRVVEPGRFDIMVGGSSASVEHATLDVTEEKKQ
jgi:beta-glucosidase